MSVSMSVPLDSDGFGRRECPNCEQEFKWRFDEEGEADEHVDQYYCPLCGQPSGVGSWWTTEQVEHMQALVMPDVLGQVQDMLHDSFKGGEHITYERSQDFGELPTPIVLVEPDDMVIISSPCHQSEPVKFLKKLRDRSIASYVAKPSPCDTEAPGRGRSRVRRYLPQGDPHMTIVDARTDGLTGVRWLFGLWDPQR